MKDKATAILTKEYQLLKEYRDQYGKYNSLLKMREDKAAGAAEALTALGVLTAAEVQQIRESILKE